MSLRMAVKATDQYVERDRGMGEDEVQPPSPTLARLGEEDVLRLTEFIHGDYGRVSHIVRALCGSQVDIDGVVAEATARAVEQLLAGQAIRDVRAWVTTAAVNLGRSDLRRQRVRRRYGPLLAASASSEDGGIDSTAMRLDVQEALRRLPRRQAEVVALYYGLDFSVRQIASTLRRSEGTVKATLFKARKFLEANLGSPDGVENR